MKIMKPLQLYGRRQIAESHHFFCHVIILPFECMLFSFCFFAYYRFGNSYIFPIGATLVNAYLSYLKRMISNFLVMHPSFSYLCT